MKLFSFACYSGELDSLFVTKRNLQLYLISFDFFRNLILSGLEMELLPGDLLISIFRLPASSGCSRTGVILDNGIYLRMLVFL